MSRVFFVSVAVMAAIVLASVDVAAAEKVVRIGRVSVDSDLPAVFVSLESNGRLSDSRISVSFVDSGVSVKKNVGFPKSARQSVRMALPEDAGLEPYVRIVFSSDQGRRVKHRLLSDFVVGQLKTIIE